jgi:hypothetical protein
MNLYLIYDKKAETFTSFFTAQGDVEAIRATVAAARQVGTPLGDYPGDFELRCVGNIDRKTCHVAVHDIYTVVGTVQTMLSAANGDRQQLNLKGE